MQTPMGGPTWSGCCLARLPPAPLYRWFRFGHSAHFYPFNSLNAESLVLKTTFLLGT